MTKLSESLEEYASEYMLSMHGWCTPEKARDLMRTVLEEKPKVVVEIGVFAGKSLFALGAAMEEIKSDGKVYGIEPWNNVACAQGYDLEDPNRKWWEGLNMGQIERAFYAVRTYLNLGERVVVLKTKSSNAVEKFRELHRAGTPIDLLHIDGNHSEEASTSDVDLFMPLVKPGGVVFMDDLNWDSTKRAQEKMLDFCGEPRVEKGEAHCYGVYKKREESEEA